MDSPVTEPIIGYRDWLLPFHDEWDTPVLTSIVARAAWERGTNVAGCYPSSPDIYTYSKLYPHSSPHHKCGCGLHAYHDLEIIERVRPSVTVRIRGLVRGWGSVFVHELGWRSEYAEVVALITYYHKNHGDIIPKGTPITMERLARYYEVPLIPSDSIAAIESEFGTPVPLSLRPKSKESERND